MQKVSEAMKCISSSSSEIGNIIKTIENIAYKTNLLAINATIEAARAGSSGKEFNVIADQIRDLANKSSEASKSTASLIETSLKSIEYGDKITKEMLISMTSIVEEINKITSQIIQISDASNEQSLSIEHIIQEVEEISEVIQTNSTTSEESAATAEQLSIQAQILKTLISKFTLNKTSL